MIYVAMSGARATLDRMTTTTSNLANAATPGFRAQLTAFRAAPLANERLRVFATESTNGYDFSEGSIQRTGRNLDVAIQGRGWLAVQTPDGTEAYTRAGNLQLSESGLLTTGSGLPVLGDGGQVTVPPDSQVMIGADGTISAMPNKPGDTGVAAVGRLKLVNPPEEELRRGDDGLFRLASGAEAPADPAVRVVSGGLESSNVNSAEALVGMIALARQFDLQMRMLQMAEQNERQAAQLLGTSP